jgi:hypothetical protein
MDALKPLLEATGHPRPYLVLPAGSNGFCAPCRRRSNLTFGLGEPAHDFAGDFL